MRVGINKIENAQIEKINQMKPLFFENNKIYNLLAKLITEKNEDVLSHHFYSTLY